VVVFPGSNCDADCYHVVRNVLGQPCDYVWHTRTNLDDFDCLILPGGFSYGDYLRVGAIARFSPVMDEVGRFAERGGLVMGICNGLQILLEAGLLPGAMLRNESLLFQCEYVTVRVENVRTPFTNRCRPGQVLRIPIAHAEGNYTASPEVVEELERAGRIVFRYTTPDGEVTRAANPNGSVAGIAGITDDTGRILGLMPHPERCSEQLLGSVDGRVIFESMISYVKSLRDSVNGATGGFAGVPGGSARTGDSAQASGGTAGAPGGSAGTRGGDR